MTPDTHRSDCSHGAAAAPSPIEAEVFRQRVKPQGYPQLPILRWIVSGAAETELRNLIAALPKTWNNDAVKAAVNEADIRLDIPKLN